MHISEIGQHAGHCALISQPVQHCGLIGGGIFSKVFNSFRQTRRVHDPERIVAISEKER